METQITIFTRLIKFIPLPENSHKLQDFSVESTKKLVSAFEFISFLTAFKLTRIKCCFGVDAASIL